jgi:hypothetical protein
VERDLFLSGLCVELVPVQLLVVTVDGYTNGDVSYRKQHFVKASSCEM